VVLSPKGDNPSTVLGTTTIGGEIKVSAKNDGREDI
jgi:hypothetical protein